MPMTTRGSSAASRSVAVLGLGAMGSAIARRLMRHGYPVTVYNRTASRAQSLAAEGARLAGSPAAAARRADVVITMVTDGPAVESLLWGSEGAVAGARAGTTFIDCSTVTPEASRGLAARLGEAGLPFLEAPVFGSGAQVMAGTLGIMVGGPEPLYQAHLDLFRVLGDKVFHMGGPGSGTTMKLCVNLILANVLGALGEAVALGERAGLETRQILDVILSSSVAPATYGRRAEMVAAGEYPAAFALKHLQKDVSFAVGAGHHLNVALPLTATAHALFTAARARGHGEEDMGAIVAFLRELAGLV